jgi:hypothetical protein
LLGRRPRDWGASAGARKGSSLTDGKLVAVVYEDTENGEKTLKETREVKQSGGGAVPPQEARL